MLNRAQLRYYVEVSFQREIIHRFEAASSDPHFITGGDDDVSFLASEHRHIVYFYVRASVQHADREIEFLQLKRFCQLQFPGDTHDVGTASMEQLGERLLEALVHKYPKREWEIRMMEDNENGAVLRYTDIV